MSWEPSREWLMATKAAKPSERTRDGLLSSNMEGFGDQSFSRATGA